MTRLTTRAAGKTLAALVLLELPLLALAYYAPAHASLALCRWGVRVNVGAACLLYLCATLWPGLFKAMPMPPGAMRAPPTPAQRAVYAEDVEGYVWVVRNGIRIGKATPWGFVPARHGLPESNQR